MGSRYMKWLKGFSPFIVLIFVLLLGFLLYSKTNLFVMNRIFFKFTNGEKLLYVSESALSEGEYLQSRPKFFSFESAKVIQQVKATSNFIESVYLVKEFPNTLNVYILERKPFATLQIGTTRCILLDEKSFVLEIDESDCKDLASKYSTITIFSEDPKVSFMANASSNYHQLELIEQVIKVLNEYKVGVASVSLDENVAVFEIDKKRKLVFSFNQDILVQLERFLAVSKELEKKEYKFKSIDFRFKRPVLSTK